MDGRTLVHISDKEKNCNFRLSSEENSSDSKLIDKKEVSFGEATTTEVESYTDADKLQEIKALRSINKNVSSIIILFFKLIFKLS
ncbi:unnamed protein product [Onchocerca flexuosa]|uniref:Uncharacterized protein n=1 Tax=Onchocerca flexuosa TaxID=387005 RepID=A0A183I873_9BILA|nr:unnamed protein product [Onchocerca flexuosa]